MNVVFINSALYVDPAAQHLSVFSGEERLAQTKKTVDSIDKHLPGSTKIFFDVSTQLPNKEHIEQVCSSPETFFVYVGDDSAIQEYSRKGLRSVSETLGFMRFLSWFQMQDFKYDRIYKVSGRYELTDDFVPNDPSYKDAFVFAEALDSWMYHEIQEIAKVKKLYRLRAWHMDGSLLPTFIRKLPLIAYDCASYRIDVEHAYYKYLYDQKVVEVKKIGVCGHLGPNGEYIDE